MVIFTRSWACLYIGLLSHWPRFMMTYFQVKMVGLISNEIWQTTDLSITYLIEQIRSKTLTKFTKNDFNFISYTNSRYEIYKYFIVRKEENVLQISLGLVCVLCPTHVLRTYDSDYFHRQWAVDFGVRHRIHEHRLLHQENMIYCNRVWIKLMTFKLMKNLRIKLSHNGWSI